MATSWREYSQSVAKSRQPQARYPSQQGHSSPQIQDWPSRPSLRLKLSRLPPNTSTWDIYSNFSKYGTLVRINIFESRTGDKSAFAEIDYEPVPQNAFWLHRIPYSSDEAYCTVAATLSESQRRRFCDDSPVKPGVKYQERMELYGLALQFGILARPQHMIAMKTCLADHQTSIRLILNLGKKEIEAHFPVLQISKNSSRVRNFRFHIALDDALKMWRLPDHTLVIHLPRPPPYSKQLAEALRSSHSQDGRMWSIEDTWARQTDIVDYTPTFQELCGTPVALQKNLNSINIARWTTFRFHTVTGGDNEEGVEEFLGTLRDWNIIIQEGTGFHVDNADGDLDKQAWDLINGKDDRHSSFKLEQELSRPQLPFSVRYQLEVCLSHGWISEYSITAEFLERLAQWPEDRARQALVYVATNQNRLFDPMVIFSDIQYSKPIRSKRLPPNCVEIYSATVTATSILFHTPSVEITHRIIRKYRNQAHRFLRVRFEDDSYRGQSRLYASTGNKMVTVFKRVKRALSQGIRLGDITYDFLAWGNSQLREHGVYFVAATSSMNADKIREEMGTFKETVVAKKAARMGQCFSTTRPVRLPSLRRIDERSLVSDVIRNGYTFTDGVGKISELAAQLVSHELKIKGRAPSLFQFRLGGCKGVLAVSKDVPGIGIQIRESQFKFKSLSGELEIIRYSEFWQPYLNRQIIMCLGHLGVPTSTFVRMQEDAIESLKQAILDDGAANRVLRRNVDPNLMTLSMCELVQAGFRRKGEPFVMALFYLWRAWSLKYLKEKAKIPVEHGAFVLGCVDETATLKGHTKDCPSGEFGDIVQDLAYMDKLPQIFIQITDMQTGEPKVIEGICILARNPSLHQGDIRVVRAVDVPALRHMRDVVVMPQTGDRDLPSMCSGGDLDGDDYIVIWDEELIPRVWNAEPFHYKPESPKKVANIITTADLIEFFHDYMRFDMLGRIAHAHLAAADFLTEGIESGVCQELLRLHSSAVDYPKTGVPAKMERHLERDRWPHFMEKKGKRYHSEKVLGELYDSVEKIKFKPDYYLPFDERILNAFEPSEPLLEEVQNIKGEYDSALQRAMTQHSIKTEFELWSTFVLDHSKKSSDYKFHEEIGDLSRVLKEQYYEALCDLAGDRDFDHLAPVAVAAYKVTKNQLDKIKLDIVRVAGACNPSESAEPEEGLPVMPFISFPWLLQDTLIKIALHAENFAATKAVEGGVLTQSASEIKVCVERNGKGNVPDTPDLNIRATKLSLHLPDPLLQIKTTTEVSSTDKYDLQKDSPVVDTPVTDVSAIDTPVTDLGPSEESPHLIELAWTQFQQIGHPDEERIEPTSGDLSCRVGREPRSGLTAMNSDLLDIEQLLENRQANSDTSYPPSPLASELTIRPTDAEASRLRSPHKTATCYYWKHHGNCYYSDETCRNAHYETGVQPRQKDQITCWFWITANHCTKSDERCKFAHWDTGITMPPPDYQFDSPAVPTSEAISWVRSRSAKRRRQQNPRRRAIVEDSDSDLDNDQTAFPRRSLPAKKYSMGSSLGGRKEAPEPVSTTDSGSEAVERNEHLSTSTVKHSVITTQRKVPWLNLDLLSDDLSPHQCPTILGATGEVASKHNVENDKAAYAQGDGTFRTAINKSATSRFSPAANNSASNKDEGYGDSLAQSAPVVQADEETEEKAKAIYGDPLLEDSGYEVEELSD